MSTKEEPTDKNAWLLRYGKTIADKGPLFATVMVANIILYSWVVDGRQEAAKNHEDLKQEVRAIRLQYDAYQKYTHDKVFNALEQNTRVIERNNMILEDLSRKMD